MFADLEQAINPNAPWWVGGIMSVLGIGYAIVRLYAYFKEKKVLWDKAQHELDATKKHAMTDEQIEARENAHKEQVPVVERLLKEIESQSREILNLKGEIAEVKETERECSEQRTRERVVLIILIKWAKKQKSPPPIPEDMLKDIEDGSRPHIPVGGH